jgi:hypothetical protein
MWNNSYYWARKDKYNRDKDLPAVIHNHHQQKLWYINGIKIRRKNFPTYIGGVKGTKSFDIYDYGNITIE